MGKLSISQRMRRSSSLSAKRAIAQHWAIVWWRQQEELLKQMGKAIACNDYDQLFWVAGQMKDLTDRKLEASTGVIQAIAGEHIHLTRIPCVQEPIRQNTN